MSTLPATSACAIPCQVNLFHQGRMAPRSFYLILIHWEAVYLAPAMALWKVM